MNEYLEIEIDGNIMKLEITWFSKRDHKHEFEQDLDDWNRIICWAPNMLPIDKNEEGGYTDMCGSVEMEEINIIGVTQ